MWNLIFLITGYLFIILLMITFFSKITIKSKENKLFKILILTNFIGYLVEILLQIFVHTMNIESMLIDIFAKLYLISIYIWFSVFSLYTFFITLKRNEIPNNERKYNIIKITHILLIIIISTFLYVLPIYKFYNITSMYSYGPSVNLLKIVLGVYTVIWIVMLLINIKTINEKKYYPIFVVILALIANIIIQTYNPTILIATVTMTFTCYVMYFTIENPDIKMMKDLRYNKAMLERENEATLKGLNKLSNSLQEPLARLTEISKKKITKKDLQETLENTGEIQKISLNLVEQINNIIDISKLTSGKLEIKKIHYLTEEAIKQLKELTDEYQVKYEITEKLPKLLYGDPEKIKQAILYLLNFIKKGFVKPKITLNIDSLTVGMLCKIKFKLTVNYRDLANNIQIYKFNNKLSLKTTLIEYEIFERIMELLQGKTDYLIEDNKITFTFSLYNKLDDLTESQESLEDVKYFDATDKRVLIIDNNLLNSKFLIEKLAKYNVKIEICSFEEDFIELINGDKTYDLVLYNEEVNFEHYDLSNEESIKNSLNRLRLIAGYRLPFVVITNDNKYLNSSIEYLNDPVDEKQLNFIVTKHLKDD